MGPFTADRLVHQSYASKLSRIASKDEASGGEALERTWVSERNFKVWLHQDRDWNIKPDRNLTLSSPAMSIFGERPKKLAV